MTYDEIVVKILARGQDPAAGTEPVREGARIYDAAIYTNLPAFRLLPDGFEPPAGLPITFGSYPLASVEHLHLHWERYQAYLAQFLAERKGPGDMRSRLFDVMSPGLERLFAGNPSDQPLRIWWSVESSELEDFPWELVAYGNKSPDVSERFSFVRGLPPQTVGPAVPFEGHLRLGIVHDSRRALDELLPALGSLPRIETIPLDGSPREALQRAARGNFELLHIISDGIVSLASDGVLYFEGPPALELTASDLASLLRTSRTAFIGFSSSGSPNPDVVEIAGHEVPSAYRAFVYLASADLPLPTIAAPLAPVPSVIRQFFWNTFYRALGETLSIEAAMSRARGRAPLPIALYLRHPHEQLFREQPPDSLFKSFDPATAGQSRSGTAAPAELDAELQMSQTLVARLDALTRSGTKTAGLSKFLEQERVHQQRLSGELETWTRPAGEKP